MVYALPSLVLTESNGSGRRRISHWVLPARRIASSAFVWRLVLLLMLSRVGFSRCEALGFILSGESGGELVVLASEQRSTGRASWP